MADRQNNIEIPPDLYKKLEAKGKEAGFSSVSEYVFFVLHELVKEEEGEEREEDEKIKERLRRLGYLD